MTEYLVIFKGYPIEDSQWILDRNLTEEVVKYVISPLFYCYYNIIQIVSYRSYNAPKPSRDIITDNISRFTLAIDNSLRKGSSRDFYLHVNFRHDVYHHLFRDKTTLFRDDFNSKYFKEGWDQCYKDYSIDDKHNYGLKLLHPVQCRLYLKWMKPGHCKKGDGTIANKYRSFVEMIKFTIKKTNC